MVKTVLLSFFVLSVDPCLQSKNIWQGDKNRKSSYPFFTDLKGIFLVQIVCDELVDEDHDPCEAPDAADGLGQEGKDHLTVVALLLQAEVAVQVVMDVEIVIPMVFPQVLALGLRDPCLHIPITVSNVGHFSFALLSEMFTKL